MKIENKIRRFKGSLTGIQAEGDERWEVHYVPQFVGLQHGRNAGISVVLRLLIQLVKQQPGFLILKPAMWAEATVKSVVAHQ